MGELRYTPPELLEPDLDRRDDRDGKEGRVLDFDSDSDFHLRYSVPGEDVVVHLMDEGR